MKYLKKCTILKIFINGDIKGIRPEVLVWNIGPHYLKTIFIEQIKKKKKLRNSTHFKYVLSDFKIL